MKTAIIILVKLIVFFGIKGESYADSTEWNLVQSIAGEGMNTAYDVAVDAQGNSITAGTFTENITIGTTNLKSFGNSTILLAKHDARGNLLWAKRFGGSGYDYGYAVEVDEDGNIYLAGAFSNQAEFGGENYTASGQRDAFLMKLQQDGSISWFNHFASDGRDFIRDISVTAEGDIAVAGRFTDQLNLGEETLHVDRETDGFGAVFSTDGELKWAERFSSRGRVNTTTVTAGKDAVYFGVEFQADLYIAGNRHASKGNHDIAVVKFNPGGELLWSRHMEGYGNDTIYDLDITPDGGLVMIGHYNNDLIFDSRSYESGGRDDLYVAQFESNGDFGWIQTGKSEYWNYGRGILAREDDLVITGYFYESIEIGEEKLDIGQEVYSGLVGYLDYDGIPTKLEIIGGDRSDFLEGITADPHQNYYVYGRFYGDFKAGHHSLTSENSSDIVLARYGDAEPYEAPMAADFDTETRDDSLFVKMELEDVSDLYYLSFETSYEKELLNFERIVPGDVMGSSPIYISSETDHGTGISIGMTSGSSTYQDGELLTMVFSLKNSTEDIESSIEINRLQAENPANRTLTMSYDQNVAFSVTGDLKVWPGDVNNDGVVDERDVLALAQHMGSSGPARSTQGVSWKGQKVTPWQDSTAAFADTDGDGVVDHEDLKAIVFNFGKSHSSGNAQKRQIAEISGSSNYEIPRLREGQTHTVTVSSNINGSITGASIRSQVSGVDEDAYDITEITPGSWADKYANDSDVLTFTYANGNTAATAIAAKGVLDIQEQELFEVSITAARDWDQGAKLVMNPISVSDSEGNQKQISETETNLLNAEDAASSLPTHTELTGNYPNPFNPETQIRFNLAEDTHVRVEVYDLLGNRITQLIDEERSAGSYTVPFSGNQLSSGTYIYRLMAGGTVDTKTMTLVK